MKAIKTLVCLLPMLAAAMSVVAAPITLGFEAEIASVLQFGGGLNLPFDIEKGDVISATFELGGDSGILRIESSEFTLETTSVTVLVENNSPGYIPFTGRIADPENTPNVDRTVDDVVDIFRVGCTGGGLGECEATSLVDASEITWIPEILLVGGSESFSADSLISASGSLNSLSFREMSLTFLSTQNGSAVKVGAFVGELYAIPEPATSKMLVVCGCTMLLSSLAWRLYRQ